MGYLAIFPHTPGIDAAVGVANLLCGRTVAWDEDRHRFTTWQNTEAVTGIYRVPLLGAQRPKVSLRSAWVLVRRPYCRACIDKLTQQACADKAGL